MKQTLEQRRDEKNRLLKKYRAKKREEWRELCKQEPRLRTLPRWLRKQGSARNTLLALHDSWVRLAPLEIKYAALRVIDKHANREAINAGGFELDDPIPPAKNLYLASRGMLGVR